jgi:hypothetical protein
VGLELGPLSLVSTTEELLKRKSSGSGLGKSGTLHSQKLAVTSPTSGDRSGGIVRSRIQAMEFSLVF